jgi:hypothetical protein
MKHTLIAATLVGLVAAGSVVAQDYPQQGSQAQSENNNSVSGNSSKESMKQCMSRQKAANSGLTHLQRQTTCENEMKASKMRKNGNDLATGSQARDSNTPQQ